MTKAERALLMFLVLEAKASLDDWFAMPLRAERNQKLDELVEALRDEEKADSRVQEPQS